MIEVKNQTAHTADIHFYGDIVNESWVSEWYPEDRSPEDIKNILDEVKGKNLNIYVNSGGGHVFGGMAIYNMLKRYQGKKTVYVDGLAGSIASVIMFAADEIIVPNTAYVMIHKPWAGVNGNADDLRKLASDLDRIQDGIINVYSENLKEGVDIQTIIDMVNAETWLTGEQAAQYFNIKVSETDALNYADFDAKLYKNTPQNLIKPITERPEVEEEPTPDIVDAFSLEDETAFNELLQFKYNL
ncbi:MAG: clp protease family protein [Clostridia bacterium]|nr:clp protease family protein [Clostridia bacterium]